MYVLWQICMVHLFICCTFITLKETSDDESSNESNSESESDVDRWLKENDSDLEEKNARAKFQLLG